MQASEVSYFPQGKSESPLQKQTPANMSTLGKGPHLFIPLSKHNSDYIMILRNLTNPSVDHKIVIEETEVLYIRFRI